MSRIPAPLSMVDTLAVSPALLNAVRDSFGPANDLFRLAGESPATPEGLINLRKALEQGQLPRTTQKRIAMAISHYREHRDSDSSYIGTSLNIVSHAGREGAERQAAELAVAKARAGITLALKIAHRQGRVGEAELSEVKSAGYTSVELLEIVGHVALDALSNYINEVFDARLVPHGLEGTRAA